MNIAAGTTVNWTRDIIDPTTNEPAVYEAIVMNVRSGSVMVTITKAFDERSIGNSCLVAADALRIGARA